MGLLLGYKPVMLRHQPLLSLLLLLPPTTLLLPVSAGTISGIAGSWLALLPPPPLLLL
jgi:hypothetical protein